MEPCRPRWTSRLASPASRLPLASLSLVALLAWTPARPAAAHAGATHVHAGMRWEQALTGSGTYLPVVKVPP